jgi:hypothetical protein
MKEELAQEQKTRAFTQLWEWMKEKTLLSALFEVSHPCIKVQGDKQDKLCIGAKYENMRIIELSATKIILMEDDRPQWRRELTSFIATVDADEVECGYRCGIVRFRFKDGSYLSLNDWASCKEKYQWEQQSAEAK